MHKKVCLNDLYLTCLNLCFFVKPLQSDVIQMSNEYWQNISTAQTNRVGFNYGSGGNLVANLTQEINKPLPSAVSLSLHLFSAFSAPFLPLSLSCLSASILLFLSVKFVNGKNKADDYIVLGEIGQLSIDGMLFCRVELFLYIYILPCIKYIIRIYTVENKKIFITFIILFWKH